MPYGDDREVKRGRDDLAMSGADSDAHCCSFFC